jgi:hypothetical protein
VELAQVILQGYDHFDGFANLAGAGGLEHFAEKNSKA